jgi:hypothetical protein
MPSRSEAAAAWYLSRVVRKYGPVSETQVRDYASRMQADRHPLIAHGLTAVAREMRPGEVVSGRVRRRGRSPSRAGRSR